MYVADTIVAPATPAGRGAVAIVRLSGPKAIDIARALWSPLHSAHEPTPRRLQLGIIRDPASGAALDHAMCVIFPARRSFTGEDVAELHCHGGIYLTRRVVALAASLGARIADPGEFTRRAFLNGRIDLTAAEAVADLVEARSESALRQALAHLDGVLSRRVSTIRDGVVEVRAHLEAEIDFADEDLNLPSRHEIAAALEKLTADIRLLHDSFARGRIARTGVRAAIIGKPNAGKSSILNLLLGSDRAIVTAIPGTTRDIIEDSIQVGPYPILLGDTAGLRDVNDEVERIGIERSRRHAAEADLILAVFDSSRPFEREDSDVAEILDGRPGVAILNKRDLPPELSAARLRQSGVTLPIIEFSATAALGLDQLRGALEDAIEEMAGGPSGDTVAISRERHRTALAQSLESLESARHAAMSGMPPEIIAVDLNVASDALASITGEISTEDILDAVFAKFCIGK